MNHTKRAQGGFFFGLLLLVFAGGTFLCPLPGRGEELSSGKEDPLFSLYPITPERRQDAEQLKKILQNETPLLEERELWENLWEPLAPRKRASSGLKLMEQIYPSRGNLREWEKIRGFWHPSLHPRSLAGLDALFVTLSALLEMNSPEADLLAYFLLREFCESPRARQVALREGPQIYETLRKKLEEKGLSPAGGWPRWKGKGTLPLARPVRGHLSVDTALAREMTFLDGQGGIASGLGSYAWDRKTGKIYRVISREDRSIFFPGSP